MISSGFISLVTAGLAPLILVAARLGGLAIFAPVYGSPVIAGRIKIFLFLGLAAVSLPVLMGTGALAGAESLTMWGFMAAVAVEIAIGALIGFIALMPMLAMQTGGLVMAQQMGLGFARFYNPAMGDEADVLENLLFLLALVTFIALGGIDWTALAILNSYEYVAVGTFNLDWSIPHLLSGLIMAAFEIGMRVAAPLLALVFLETVAIGYISKTVPQLNILSLGFPLRIMIGLGAIIAGVVVLEGVLVEFIDVILDVMMNWHSGGGLPGG